MCELYITDKDKESIDFAVFSDPKAFIVKQKELLNYKGEVMKNISLPKGVY